MKKNLNQKLISLIEYYNLMNINFLLNDNPIKRTNDKISISHKSTKSDRLEKLKSEGILITLGPTKCSTYVFGIFESYSIDFVRKVLEEDIYWKQGIWTNFEVYPWIQAF